MSEQTRRAAAVQSGARPIAWMLRLVVVLACSPIAALASCADLLGLHQGHLPSGSCERDEECGPGASCRYSTCLPDRCESGATICSGHDALQCGASGTWVRDRCEAICLHGACDIPPSCATDEPECGLGTERTSCCSSIAIEGSSFEFPYENSDSDAGAGSTRGDRVRRYVRSYALDRFEVTIARFLQFLRAYDREGREPLERAGAHPAFPESGWKSIWSNNEQLPGSQIALEGVLHRADQDLSQSEDRELPIGGTDWYLASAFCVWDGGRLPTEAEWAYAAFGGNSDQRYPWQNMNELDPEITHDHAQYSDEIERNDGPSRVGAHPAGRGIFGHHDLAGNLVEWVADVHHMRLRDDCPARGRGSARPNECLELDGGDQRVMRGGAYHDSPAGLRNVRRTKQVTDFEAPWFGFRCARDVGESTPRSSSGD